MKTTKNQFIGVIDEGTNTIAFSVGGLEIFVILLFLKTCLSFLKVYSTPDFKEICCYKKELATSNPKDGWFEQDPIEMIESVKFCAEKACMQLTELGFDINEIVSIGITNQRETTIVWDKLTGDPLYNAIGNKLYILYVVNIV